MNKKEDKVQISIRIPSEIHENIQKCIKKRANDINQTDIIVSILENYFGNISKDNESILEDINDLFSIGEKIFMPERVYMQLLQKSNGTMQHEIDRNIISTKMIGGSKFVIMDTDLDVNAISIEQTVQKKQLVYLERTLEKRLNYLEKKLEEHIETHEEEKDFFQQKISQLESQLKNLLQ